MSLFQRTVRAIAWNSVENAISLVILFVRSILLARWLPVEIFGIYGWTSSIIQLTSVLASFGMEGAFIHRAKQSQDEQQTAAVHFTLATLFGIVWALIHGLAALFITDAEMRTSFLVIMFSTLAVQLTQTPELVLQRRVVHRRLALTQLTITVLTTAMAIWLALRGETLWALLSVNLVTAATRIVSLFLWRPVWRPRFAWHTDVVRYFLSFGSRGFAARLLGRALDRADDLWVGAYLGNTALGFYSRAYTMANYPRRILAEPVYTVSFGTYAELKGQRLELSRAFFRVNALLIRSGFLAGGLLALIAPEFIHLLLGAKWMPMLNAFRLMLVYTLMTPIRSTVDQLFVAVGRPEILLQIRVLQAVVLAAGLYLIGLPYGIVGVAIVVDLVVILGLGFLLQRARIYVDISLKSLFWGPIFALLVAFLGASLVYATLDPAANEWLIAAIKSFVFIALFGGLIMILEYKQLAELIPLFYRR